MQSQCLETPTKTPIHPSCPFSAVTRLTRSRAGKGAGRARPPRATARAPEAQEDVRVCPGHPAGSAPPGAGPRQPGAQPSPAPLGVLEGPSACSGSPRRRAPGGRAGSFSPKSTQQQKHVVAASENRDKWEVGMGFSPNLAPLGAGATGKAYSSGLGTLHRGPGAAASASSAAE